NAQQTLNARTTRCRRVSTSSSLLPSQFPATTRRATARRSELRIESPADRDTMLHSSREWESPCRTSEQLRSGTPPVALHTPPTRSYSSHNPHTDSSKHRTDRTQMCAICHDCDTVAIQRQPKEPVQGARGIT